MSAPKSELVLEISLEDVLRFQKSRPPSEFVLLDVRDPNETVRGMLPGARALPLPELQSALSLSSEEFFEKYKFQRPLSKGSQTPMVVTYCGSGNRGTAAYKLLRNSGYSNVRLYRGGWKEYSKKSKL